MVTGKKVNKDSVSAGVCAVLSDVLFVTPWTGARQTPLSLGILQARNLKWVAMPSSRGSSQPRDQTQVSRITGGFFTTWARREALLESSCRLMLSRVLKHNSHHKSWPHLDSRKQLFMLSQKLVGYYQTRTRLLSFSWWQFPGEQDSCVLLRSRHAGSHWHMCWSIQRDLGRAPIVLIASTVPWHHILPLTLTKRGKMWNINNILILHTMLGPEPLGRWPKKRPKGNRSPTWTLLLLCDTNVCYMLFSCQTVINL